MSLISLSLTNFFLWTDCHFLNKLNKLKYPKLLSFFFFFSCSLFSCSSFFCRSFFSCFLLWSSFFYSFFFNSSLLWSSFLSRSLSFISRNNFYNSLKISSSIELFKVLFLESNYSIFFSQNAEISSFISIFSAFILTSFLSNNNITCNNRLSSKYFDTTIFWL